MNDRFREKVRLTLDAGPASAQFINFCERIQSTMKPSFIPSPRFRSLRVLKILESHIVACCKPENTFAYFQALAHLLTCNSGHIIRLELRFKPFLLKKKLLESIRVKFENVFSYVLSHSGFYRSVEVFM